MVVLVLVGGCCVVELLEVARIGMGGGVLVLVLVGACVVELVLVLVWGGVVVLVLGA